MRDKFSNGYILKSMGLSLIIVGIILITFSNPWPIVKGFAFGSIIAMVLFKHMYLTLNRGLSMEAARASRYVTVQYFIRYLIYGVTLMIAAKAPYLNLTATFCGLLIMKVTIHLNNFYELFKERTREGGK